MHVHVYSSKNIRMGITIFKYFIWGGISSYIRSEIMFYGNASIKIFDHDISDDTYRPK